VPGCEVGYGYPGRYTCPKVGSSSGHEEAHVTTARSADQENPLLVYIGLFLGILDGIEDILYGEIGARGLGVSVWTSEVRVDVGPTVFDAMILHGLVEFLTVVGAPRMKSDEERDRHIVFVRSKKDGRLFGTIYGTGDSYLANLAMEECWN